LKEELITIMLFFELKKVVLPPEGGRERKEITMVIAPGKE